MYTEVHLLQITGETCEGTGQKRVGANVLKSLHVCISWVWTSITMIILGQCLPCLVRYLPDIGTDPWAVKSKCRLNMEVFSSYEPILALIRYRIIWCTLKFWPWSHGNLQALTAKPVTFLILVLPLTTSVSFDYGIMMWLCGLAAISTSARPKSLGSRNNASCQPMMRESSSHSYSSSRFLLTYQGIHYQVL